ncbi:MAG: hypothetical protein ACK4NA_04350 [Alphaproteobacteria bacterium]
MGIVLIWGDEFFQFATSKKWQIVNLYTAIFGLASVATSFLATFYGTVQSISGGFLQRLRNSRYFSELMSQVKQAIRDGFILCLISIPMMVIVPVSKNDFPGAILVIALWAGFSIFSLFMFFRCVSTLFLIFEDPPPPRRGAG